MRSAVLLLLLAGCDGKVSEWTNQVTGGSGTAEANSAQQQGGSGTTTAKENGGTPTSGGPTTTPGTEATAAIDPAEAAPEDPTEVRHLKSSDCNTMTDGGPVKGPDCVTADIKCGETVIGHTRGGVKRYDTKFYEKNYCWPATLNRNGGDERIYRFIVDEQGQKGPFMVTSTIDTPCAELDVTMMRGKSMTTCPTTSDICDTSNRHGRTHVSVQERVDPGEVWYLLVEGVDESEGMYALTVTCGNG